MAQQKLLITEAFEDENFFKSLLRNLNMTDVVVTSNPTGKGNAIQTFSDTLGSRTKLSRDRIGLVVDADQGAHGAGYVQTVNDVNQRVTQLSFNPLAALAGGGQVATSNSMPNLRVGVWIMPNNLGDGAMEDFLIASIASNKVLQFQYAQQKCNKALAQELNFPARAHHISKAHYGTWTAWQDPPRSSFAKAMQNQLFDTSTVQFAALSSWLRWLYA